MPPVRRSPGAQSLSGRLPRIDIDEDGPVDLDGNRQLERKVAPGLPHRPMGHSPEKPFPGNGEPFEAAHLQPQAESAAADKRSAKPIHNVSDPGNEGGTREKRRDCRLSGADSAACLLPVQHAKHRESTTLPIRPKTR